jgi:cytochrome c553
MPMIRKTMIRNNGARKLLSACLVGAALCVTGCVNKQMVGNDSTVQGTLQVCSSCHGLEGRSQNSTFPNLAGQQHDYLVAQLQAFRGKTRADPHAHTYMWGMAAKLDDATIEGVAKFFAAQTPAAGTAQDPALVVAGAEIAKSGIPAENVPACISCHGDTLGGAFAIPRLAGQHREYISNQLEAFQVNSRANEMMHANAKNLTAQQIRAVSAYLASL